MIVDSHSHVVFPVEKHIEIMTNEGIDKTVLFSTVVHPEKATNYKEYKQELSTLYKILKGELNPIDLRVKAIEELKNIIKGYSNKFVGFGSCPIGLDLKQTENWINENITKNLFKGIGELVLGEGQVGMAENIFKSISTNDQYPLWFHTFNPLTVKDIRELLDLAKKYSNVKVILGHGAGSYWLEILEEIINFNNIYFDISASFTTHSVKIAAELIPERVLFSVDMPYNTPAVMKKIVDESVKDAEIKKLIFAGNIKELLEI